MADKMVDEIEEINKDPENGPRLAIFSSDIEFNSLDPAHEPLKLNGVLKEKDVSKRYDQFMDYSNKVY